MKSETQKIVKIALSTLVLGLLLGWLLFGGSKGNATEEHQHTSEVSGETIWTCSMHPQIRQTEPGDCPICGMDLIPLENDNGSELDPMAVSMSKTAMQLANVTTEIVGKTAPVKLIDLNGKVEADERSIYSQSSHIPGRVERLMVNFTGEYIKQGQIIAYIYSPDLVTAQEELFEARKVADTQPQFFNAAKEKLKNWKLSDNQIAQILQSGTVKEELPIHADVSGYVTEKMVNLGDYVNKGKALYQIANLNSVWVLFDIYESDMPWVRKGDEVVFTIPSLPGENFKGRISYIDPVINPMTRVAKARIEIGNTGLRLKPEMFASGTVKAKQPIASEAITIPKSAVMWTGERSVVYIKNTTSNGVNFVLRDVTLGPSLGNGFIVKEGLQEGDEIAVNGTFSIDAAAQLAGKPSMMNPEGGPAMTGHNHGGMKMGDDKGTGGSDHSEMDMGDVKQESKTDHSDMDQRIAATGIFQNQLKQVLSAYLELKDALVNDNAAKSNAAAKKVLSALEHVDMKQLTDKKAHGHWMTISKEISNSANSISKISDIKAQRDHFKHLSAHLSKGVKLFGVDQKIYEQFCPMADNNKGAYWLSTTKEIKNPYFGEAMLTCGEITDEM
ncbi:efflux RND transporter periplasmic adaptor subunit [Flagellimonas okinawensis]|uniref:Efflux RND transporter periplasmic adaptor subunit n=1 Tax=Flagellimonas okinawensis TaxID=3031324 RepID=A0ABT5XK55_9FLAO|nr:efflux RND transporter periplasmic adaptor subunit [[Muricauda] okinawensis]MDF0706212.1 efflux RND transporter periplasmic adaptor subunit [[Muricauda] okinawensis]